jgi:hypothetical protein
MAVQNTAVQLFPVASEHLEQVTRGVSAFTVDPYKNALYYFFPFVGAFLNSYHELRVDPALEAMMPPAQTDLMLREIKELTNCARIERDVVPYVALNHAFSNCGGSYSITKPALFIPEQYLFRRNGNSPFTQERPEENLAEKQWVFSDDETRFLIARELGQIKENSVLLKVAIKVAVLAALFTIYASPFGWTLGLSLAIGAIGLYIFSERFFQAKADMVGTEILGRRIPNPVRVAISALEKIRQQNLYRRENSKLARLYITEEGNNVLDFIHPFLTTRISELRKCERNF